MSDFRIHDSIRSKWGVANFWINALSLTEISDRKSPVLLLCDTNFEIKLNPLLGSVPKVGHTHLSVRDSEESALPEDRLSGAASLSAWLQQRFILKSQSQYSSKSPRDKAPGVGALRHPKPPIREGRKGRHARPPGCPELVEGSRGRSCGIRDHLGKTRLPTLLMGFEFGASFGMALWAITAALRPGTNGWGLGSPKATDFSPATRDERSESERASMKALEEMPAQEALTAALRAGASPARRGRGFGRRRRPGTNGSGLDGRPRRPTSRPPRGREDERSESERASMKAIEEMPAQGALTAALRAGASPARGEV